MKELSTFPRGEESIIDKAENYIESYVLWMVSSEEHLSARAAAVKCGCNSCVNTYNQYLDFLAGDQFQGQFDQYKITPKHAARHIKWGKL